jgi:hypothetical protein
MRHLVSKFNYGFSRIKHKREKLSGHFKLFVRKGREVHRETLTARYGKDQLNAVPSLWVYVSIFVRLCFPVLVGDNGTNSCSYPGPSLIGHTSVAKVLASSVSPLSCRRHYFNASRCLTT